MTVRRVLIANRGEIAVRIIKACQALSLETVIVVSTADRESLGAKLADRCVCIGPPPARDSYLRVDSIIHAAIATGCDALHPGYGFLSERPELAAACAENGIIFVGPDAKTIHSMGNKVEARKIAARSDVPLVPGLDNITDVAEVHRFVDEHALPILIKAAAGGGGRGMKVVSDARELATSFQTAAAEAKAAFGDGTLYVEKYLPDARHIEIQILADAYGNAIHLGERDCSSQRRYQKIIEESPAASLPAPLRERMCESAVRLAQRVGYRNAGTIEFVVEQDAAAFYFLEMNTRIQVEHPVTEMVTGIDIVREQLRIASGEPLELSQNDIQVIGHSIEARVTAESVDHGFRPSPGTLAVWDPPAGEGIRVDSHCFAGYGVPPFYDSLLAKVIVHGPTRVEAIKRLRQALISFRIAGVESTLAFLIKLVDSPRFCSAEYNTRWVEDLLTKEPTREPAVASS